LPDHPTEHLAANNLYRFGAEQIEVDRKSTRLNSSHVSTSYAVFCLKKKNNAATRLPFHPSSAAESASRHRCNSPRPKFIRQRKSQESLRWICLPPKRKPGRHEESANQTGQIHVSRSAPVPLKRAGYVLVVDAASQSRLF